MPNPRRRAIGLKANGLHERLLFGKVVELYLKTTQVWIPTEIQERIAVSIIASFNSAACNCFNVSVNAALMTLNCSIT